MSRPALSAIALGVAGLVLSAIWVTGLEGDCRARWGRSGFTYEWRNSQCMVLAGSKWLPEFAIKVPSRPPDVQRATPD